MKPQNERHFSLSIFEVLLQGQSSKYTHYRGRTADISEIESVKEAHLDLKYN